MLHCRFIASEKNKGIDNRNGREDIPGVFFVADKNLNDGKVSGRLKINEVGLGGGGDPTIVCKI
jgi:hypothetical protein